MDGRPFLEEPSLEWAKWFGVDIPTSVAAALTQVFFELAVEALLRSSPDCCLFLLFHALQLVFNNLSRP